ncbi:striatin-4 [Lonchura striata]
MAAERAPPARAQPPPPGPAPGPAPAPAAGPEPAARTGLSLPGILHFIQHEWARFEAEKGRWEAERAELQAQVAFLQGERRGQESLKLDLVRRIRMLEFALKQERCKLQKLKLGPGEKRPEEPLSNGPVELEGAWRDGRRLLRQNLEELGYSDTIVAMRSRRLRALLCPQVPCGRPRRSWSPRLTLRSHFDAVRALAFVPCHPALVTASEDATLKLWDLQKPLGPKKSAALDVEPVYAFRGHRGPVLAVAVAPGDTGDSGDTGLCCSAGVDARIRCWRLPGLDSDPYDGYDPRVLRALLEGHADAVWGLAWDGAGRRLASCSADGTVRLWEPRGDRDSGTDGTGTGTGTGSCLSVLHGHKGVTHLSPRCPLTCPVSDHGVPTSVTFVPTQPAHLAAGFRSGATVLYDLEATKATLVSPNGGGRAQVNQVLAHPWQPLTITASDDGAIRYLDNRTGSVVHSVVAHLDAVTCLALDSSGSVLMSGSHDCSLRLWHLCPLRCVQELPAHRRKHHEAVLAVAFHPRRPLGASAGADGLAKVFV